MFFWFQGVLKLRRCFIHCYRASKSLLEELVVQSSNGKVYEIKCAMSAFHMINKEAYIYLEIEKISETLLKANIERTGARGVDVVTFSSNASGMESMFEKESAAALFSVHSYSKKHGFVLVERGVASVQPREMVSASANVQSQIVQEERELRAREHVRTENPEDFNHELYDEDFNHELSDEDDEAGADDGMMLGGQAALDVSGGTAPKRPASTPPAGADAKKQCSSGMFGFFERQIKDKNEATEYERVLHDKLAAAEAKAIKLEDQNQLKDMAYELQSEKEKTRKLEKKLTKLSLKLSFPPQEHYVKLETAHATSLVQQHDEFQALLAAKDAEINELKALPESKHNAPAEKAIDEQLAMKDTDIKAKDEQLAVKDAEIKAKDEQLAVKDNMIKAKDEQLADKDAEIKAKDEQLAVKDAEIKAKDEQLAVKDAEIKAKDEVELEHERYLGTWIGIATELRGDVVDMTEQRNEAWVRESKMGEENKKFTDDILELTGAGAFIARIEEVEEQLAQAISARCAALKELTTGYEKKRNVHVEMLRDYGNSLMVYNRRGIQTSGRFEFAFMYIGEVANWSTFKLRERSFHITLHGVVHEVLQDGVHYCLMRLDRTSCVRDVEHALLTLGPELIMGTLIRSCREQRHKDIAAIVKEAMQKGTALEYHVGRVEDPAPAPSAAIIAPSPAPEAAHAAPPPAALAARLSSVLRREDEDERLMQAGMVLANSSASLDDVFADL